MSEEKTNDQHERVTFRASVPRELVNELVNLIPFTVPSPAQSEREVMYAAGQQSVVRLLLQLSERDNASDIGTGSGSGRDPIAAEGKLDEGVQ